MKFFKPSWMVAFVALNLSLMVAPVSFADSLTTPFNLELSSQSTLTLLGGLSQFKSPAGELKTDLPDEVMTSPYSVSLSGIHLTLDYAFNTPTQTDNLEEWTIQSKSISADIAVDSLQASETVIEQSGGDTLTLQVTASCSNIHLQLAPGATQMNAAVDLSLNGAVASFILKNFSANWTPTAWQITSMNCQGPNGFSQLVQQAAATQLQSINPFLPAIETQIQAQLTSASSTPLSWTLQAPGNSGVSVTFQPDNLQLLSNGGAALSGLASFNFSRLNKTTCQSLIQTPAATPNTTDSLTLPISAVEGLLHCASLNGSVVTSFTSQSFPAFQALLENWFLKLFIWPDLVRFNSKSLFNFEVFPTSAPTFGAMSANSAGGFSFNLNAPLTLAIEAPESSGPVPYVNLSTNLSGPATLLIQNGVISLKQSSNSLPVSAIWDLIFVQTYKPDQDIWTSAISGYLKSFLAQTGLNYSIPALTAPGSFSMSVNSAAPNGSSVDISLGIKTLSSPTQ